MAFANKYENPVLQPKTWASQGWSGRQHGNAGAYLRSCGVLARVLGRVSAAVARFPKVSTVPPAAEYTSSKAAWEIIRSGSAARSHNSNVLIVFTELNKRCTSLVIWSECTRKRSLSKSSFRIGRWTSGILNGSLLMILSSYEVWFTANDNGRVQLSRETKRRYTYRVNSARRRYTQDSYT